MFGNSSAISRLNWAEVFGNWTIKVTSPKTFELQLWCRNIPSAAVLHAINSEHLFTTFNFSAYISVLIAPQGFGVHFRLCIMISGAVVQPVWELPGQKSSWKCSSRLLHRAASIMQGNSEHFGSYQASENDTTWVNFYFFFCIFNFKVTNKNVFLLWGGIFMKSLKIYQQYFPSSKIMNHICLKLD